MTNFILHQSVIQYINNNSKKLNSSKKQKKIDHTIHYSIFHCMKASACNCIKKGTLAEVFSCEFCEIFKNTFSYRTPPVAASQIIALNKDIRPCSHYTV